MKNERHRATGDRRQAFRPNGDGDGAYWYMENGEAQNNAGCSSLVILTLSCIAVWLTLSGMTVNEDVPLLVLHTLQLLQLT